MAFIFYFLCALRYSAPLPDYSNNELVILSDVDLGIVNLFCSHALIIQVSFQFHYQWTAFLVISFLLLSLLFWLQIFKHPYLRFEATGPSFELVHTWLDNTQHHVAFQKTSSKTSLQVQLRCSCQQKLNALQFFHPTCWGCPCLFFS